VWKCTNAQAGTPNFTLMAGSPPTPEELVCLPNGNLYAACGGNGIYVLPHGGATWYSLNGAGVDGTGYWTAIDGLTIGANDVVTACCSKPASLAAMACKLTVPSAYTGTIGSVTYASLTGGTITTATVAGGGYTWWNSASLVVLGKSGFVNPCLRLDPADATGQKVYIAGSMGLWQSANGGTAWDIANSGLPQFLAHPVAADPNHTLHAVFGDSDWGCFDDTAANGTETASTLVNDPPVKDAGPPITGVQCFSLAFDPTDSTVYAGVGRKYTNALGEIYARTYNNPGGVGTWDGGGTWTSFTPALGALGFGTAAGGSPAQGLCALRDASANRILIAAAWANGLWRWAPTGGGGAYQWTQVSTVISAAGQIGNCLPFAHVPGSAYVYCFDRNLGIFRSADYGATWTATPIWSSTAATQLSGDLAAHPLNAGELWFTTGTGGGTLYKATGAQSGTITPVAQSVANAGPVGISANGTIFVATLDTGVGSGLQFSTTDGAAFGSALATGDHSFAQCNAGPEHIALGPETPPRVYVSGSNIVAAGLASTGPAGSGAFTLVQSSGNLLGGSGAISAFFSQAGGTGSQAGSTLAVRLVMNDCQMTVTPPSPNWVLVAEGKSGTTTGQARAQIWVQLNNHGGLGTPGPAAADSQPLANRASRSRRGGAAPGRAGGVSAPAGTPQVFTYSNPAAIVKGKLHEYTTPLGTVQFLDHPILPLPGGAGTVAGGAGQLASATSLLVGTGGANTQTGGLGLAIFGADLTSPASQTWPALPAGWAPQGSAVNLTVVFECADLATDASGTTSVTAPISLGTSAMTSWAAACCTLYSLATSAADITTVVLPPGAVSVAYPATTMTATGGAPPYTWAVTSGTFPSGLTLVPGPGGSPGQITGTPTTAGTYIFQVTVEDQAAQTDSDWFTVIVGAASTLAITGAPALVLPPDATGTPYTFTFGATGGTP
jgi:hypothetical protein